VQQAISLLPFPGFSPWRPRRRLARFPILGLDVPVTRDRPAQVQTASPGDELIERVARTADRAGVATWVFTIARNKRIDALRRQRRPEIDLEDPALVPDPPASAEESVLAHERGRRLAQALATLPKEQAALIRLAYFDDRVQSDIAAETRLPLGTVKSRLRLALAKLRRALGEFE
jgi:RNA polymerase sigma factor (sigma-70 family)